MYDLIECDFHSIYGIDLNGHVRTQEGWVGVMQARSARWFLWRVHGMVTDPSSRFHAVVGQRRKDEATEREQLVTTQPGDEDY